MADHAVVIDIQPYLAQLGYAGAFVSAMVLGILHLNKRASANRTSIDQDKASSNILAVALRQRDEALKAAETAWAQRTSDAAQIAAGAVEKDFYDRDRKAWEMEKIRFAEDYMQLESLARKAARELRDIDPERAALIFPSDWAEL